MVVATLLISTYDLGRQPFGLASAAACLQGAGVEVACADLAKERLPEDEVRRASFVAFFLPMHTAARLAIPVIDRVRALNPQARLCAYGLYAPLNAELLRAHGVGTILGGEFEDDLVRAVVMDPAGREAAFKPCATDGAPIGPAANGRATGAARDELRPASVESRAARPEPPLTDTFKPVVPRVRFLVPAREKLPPLSRYAALRSGTERRIAGYTEASRGCKHRCRHCPIVPVYEGRFRTVPSDIVLADVRMQVAAGARHITFGDPDFFNGIRHALAVVEKFSAACPGVTYDVTIKIEHLLRHAEALPVLRDTGCAFVTSAVESIDDRVLKLLDKGHTRADFHRVVGLMNDVGLPLAPTFVAFTPWTTLTGYCELLQEIDRLGLVENVPPIQLALRLLVCEGSRLLELEDIRRVIGPFAPASLTYPWKHSDPGVDELQRAISELVGVRLTSSRNEVFARVWDAAHEAASLPAPRRPDAQAPPRATVPYLDEPWYC